MVNDVAWPPDCTPLTLVRGSDILRALPETTIEPGDRLVCLTKTTQAEALHHLLAAASA